MGSFDPWLWTVPSPTQCTLTREQWPVPSLFYARISLSIPPCHAPTKPSQAARLAVWPLRAYNRGHSKLLEVSPAFMLGPLAWGPLNMRWLMFSVGWGWGDSARMDGPRASSYRMPRCGRVSDVITGSPSKCAPTLAEQSCLHEGRETPTAFAHVSHRGNSRRRWNAKAEYPDVISHPESSPGQLLTHLGLSFVHSWWTFWKDLLLNSSAILQRQQTWCSEMANEARLWQSSFIPHEAEWVKRTWRGERS